jgi:cyclopropane fatty-acyl-phospholipid synthase-like methyltransferase
MRVDPRNFLAIPKLYQSFQNLISGPNARRRVVFEFLKVKSGNNVLDVGCGPGNMLPLLPEVTYCGIDISSKYIAAAQAQHGRKARFLVRAVTDKTSFEDLGKFDLVMAIALIHHLTDAEVSSVFQAAKAVLNSGGRVVTFDNVFVPEQSRIARWIIKLDRGNHVRTKDEYVALANRHFQNVDVTILHDLLRIPYTHIIMECR